MGNRFLPLLIGVPASVLWIVFIEKGLPMRQAAALAFVGGPLSIFAPEERLSEISHCKTAHDVGVQQERQHLIQEQGLKPTDFVNPLENHGEFGQGIDDVMIGAAGNYWIVEYKGGQGTLKAGQMQQPWVQAKITDLPTPAARLHTTVRASSG